MANFLEKRSRLSDPYVTAGNRVYVIGSQDGSFPDEGGHIAGEMMGVWNHPIKLLDGFFIGIRESDDVTWPKADAFRTYPFYTEHITDQKNYRLVRRQFVPDDQEGVVVTLFFTNQTEEEMQVTLIFGVRSDLRPGWLGTEQDGQDAADQHDGYLVFSDTLQPWTAMVATDAKNYAIQTGTPLPHETNGRGVSASITIPISCAPHETITTRFVIAGSESGWTSCQETLEHMLVFAEDSFAQKAARYQKIEEKTALTIPNQEIQDALPWIKYNTDWLERKTSLGRGLGAGLPEYPWWFGCDNGYAVPGILCLGWFDLAMETVRLIARSSQAHNGNGRIIHEMSTTGVVYNPGNTQETPQFCMMVWDVFAWTGDMDFLREMYPIVQKAIEWTLSQASDDADFPSGYGIIEVEHLNDRVIDSAVYTYQALRCCADMAEVLGDLLTVKLLRDRAVRLQTDIMNRFWMDSEGLFADMIARPSVMNTKLRTWADGARAKGLTDAADYYLRLVDESGEDNERPYLLKHWVINTPLEIGMVPVHQAVRALDRMRTEFGGPHGMYLSGLERQAMMTISTGVQAIAECAYDRPDDALLWIEKIVGTLSLRMPGSITEMSPDYGCFVQAWTAHGVFSPIVRYMFGVTPLAHQSICVLDPCMPTTWERAELRGLQLGENVLDLYYERLDGHDVLRIFSADDYTLRFRRQAAVLNHNGQTATEWPIRAGEHLTVRLASRQGKDRKEVSTYAVVH